MRDFVKICLAIVVLVWIFAMGLIFGSLIVRQNVKKANSQTIVVTETVTKETIEETTEKTTENTTEETTTGISVAMITDPPTETTTEISTASSLDIPSSDSAITTYALP